MIERRYGQYILKYDKRGAVAQVTMYDLGDIRFPLVWSKTMTVEQGLGALALFEAIGYFDMPVTT